MVEGGHAGEILEHIIDLHLFGDAVAADGGDKLLHTGLDDEDHMVKPSANRVVDGVLHQNLAVGAEAVNLLVSAVAGAHARRHDE